MAAVDWLEVNMCEIDDKQTKPPAASAGKKPYASPELVEYGTAAELTAGPAGTGADVDNHKFSSD